MLTYNHHNNKFIWVGPDIDDDVKILKDAGFFQSTNKDVRARIGRGNLMFFTDSIYSVVAYILATDNEVDQNIVELMRDELEEFQASNEIRTDYMPPAPEGCHYLDYQRAGIAYARQRRHTLIGDAPGLGKTIQAIGYCNSIDAQRVLVICPASVRINWQREIFKWSTIVDRRAHKTWLIRSGDDGVSPLAHFNVISFDLMRNETIYKTACRMKWDVVIIDEAHYLKSPEAKRTINILGNSLIDGVVKGCRHILALTGTPLPNRPREAYTLLRTLCWDAIDWMSHDSFVMTYNPSQKMPTGYVLEDSQRLLELQTRMRCNLMVRRHKEDVLPDLPDKMYELTYIDIETNSVAIKQVLKQERLLNFTLDQLMNPDPSILGQISTVRRMMGEAMVPGMVAYISMLLDGGIDKLVVFAHHRTVIAALLEALTKYNPVCIQGDTSLKKRQQAIDSFQEDDNIKLFIGQLQAAGTGITLTAASDVVLCEASWVPGENEQAVDRCHRIGQENSVLARYLVVEGSISEKIIGRALKKHHTTHAALDSLIME